MSKRGEGTEILKKLRRQELGFPFILLFPAPGLSLLPILLWGPLPLLLTSSFYFWVIFSLCISYLSYIVPTSTHFLFNWEIAFSLKEEFLNFGKFCSKKSIRNWHQEGLFLGYLQPRLMHLSVKHQRQALWFLIILQGVPFGLILVIPSIPAPLSPTRKSNCEGSDLSPL